MTIITNPTSGRSEHIDVAAARCVRTGIAQMSGDVQTTRMDELGIDLVLVSAHLGARPSHEVWQGQVFSRSGNSEKYPDFVASTGYGTATGLCGINCRHSFGPYMEGMHNPFEGIDTEENNKRYEMEQGQRAEERKIRDQKRKVAALDTEYKNMPEGEEKDKLASKLSGERRQLSRYNKEYTAYCEKNELRPLTERLKVNDSSAKNRPIRIENESEKIYNKGAISGAYNDSNDPNGKKRNDHAIRYYEELKNSDKESIVNTIASNTGVDAEKVSKMYDHLLIKEYDLDDGKKHFDPDYNIAESIRRLREGTNIQKHDVILIGHESTEYDLMNDLHMEYDDAHALANQNFNYQIELKKWLEQKKK